MLRVNLCSPLPPSDNCTPCNLPNIREEKQTLLKQLRKSSWMNNSKFNMLTKETYSTNKCYIEVEKSENDQIWE